MKKKNYNDPLELTAEQLEKAGDVTAFLRIVAFKNGVFADAVTDEKTMVLNTALLMMQQKDIAKMLKAAVMIHKKLKKHPLGSVVLKMMLSGSEGEHGNDTGCDCPTCQLMREMERRKKEN